MSTSSRQCLHTAGHPWSAYPPSTIRLKVRTHELGHSKVRRMVRRGTLTKPPSFTAVCSPRSPPPAAVAPCRAEAQQAIASEQIARTVIGIVERSLATLGSRCSRRYLKLVFVRQKSILNWRYRGHLRLTLYNRRDTRRSFREAQQHSRSLCNLNSKRARENRESWQPLQTPCIALLPHPALHLRWN